ncbi:MAG: class I SAM-dependent methyltransferase [Saprospiraceae bacterium]|nr:class I SAM-dependent methyltransferase [Saprospiraceae bacterium]
MKFTSQIIQYVRYYLRGETIYRIHSPIGFSLIESIFRRPGNSKFSDLESMRQELLISKEEIANIDLGAGKSKRNSATVRVERLAKTSISNISQCQQLYNLCQWQDPRTVLELGTSLGFSSSYLQLAQPNARLLTIEGNPHLADRAESMHRKIFKDHLPEIYRGDFSEVLPQLLPTIDNLDLVFIDGNHTFEATSHYLESIKPVLSVKSMLILHDIYWSTEMTKAWEFAKQMGSNKMTIDLFHMGIVLFHPDIYKTEHLTIVPYWMKPWKIGLFARSVH